MTRLSSTLGVVAPRHVLAADWLHEAWRPERVAELLALFDAAGGRYRIDLMTTAYEAGAKPQLLAGALPRREAAGAGGGAADGAGAQPPEAAAAAAPAAAVLTEPWFGMEAVTLELPAWLTESWAAAPVPPELALPPPNPYIPSDFSLACDAEAGGPERAAAAADAAAAAAAVAAGVPAVLATPPELVIDEPGALLCVEFCVEIGFCFGVFCLGFWAGEAAGRRPFTKAAVCHSLLT